MSKFFIDRPVFAAVLSIVIVIAGAVSVTSLPIAQYPEIAPPTVQVTCMYPGANAVVVSETVAAPIEQQVTGVENMLYMSSQCTNDGQYSLTVTFDVGVNLDMAQVLVQNRVNLALPSLPDVVKQTGVSVKKKSPSILLVINLFSPDQSVDQLGLSNYATIYLRDELAQVSGVGDISMFGQQDYSMRIWLDPDKVASRGLTVAEVVGALKEQNVQVAAGSLGRPPVPTGQAFQYTLSTLGRLTTETEFRDIIVRSGKEGEVVRLKELVSDERFEANGDRLGGVQLGAKNQDTLCFLNGQPSVGLSIYQLPGSNALETADRIEERMNELKASFPKGIDYGIVYDTTPFIDESIHEVFKALRDAIVLVGIVVLIFLQSWRATLIPLIAVPVAIVGTFAVMAGLGFSLNNLSLLGLVLAIGIVVDDAIVVVEAVEHHLEHGLSPAEASRKAMDEVAVPVIAISLVLMAVFIPCAFISGITGQFFRQFAVTIAVSTFFSALNSLTLSPALAALMLKPKDQQRDPLTRLLNLSLGWFFRLFNKAFDKASSGYASVVGWLLRLSVISLLIYGALLYGTWESFTRVPVGFVPAQDKGYLLVNVQLPDAASLERTTAVMEQLDRIARGTGGAGEADGASGGIPGISDVISIPGMSVVQNANGSNFGSMFIILDEFHDRHGPELTSDAIAATLRRRAFMEVQDASVAVFGPPAVDGLGNAGGFKIMIQDRATAGLQSLQEAADTVAQAGNQVPGLVGLFNPFRADTPQMYVDVDRTKCKTMGVALNDVFMTLQVYLGGFYTNDFNQFGRTWQVNLQADPAFRLTPEHVRQLKVRNNRLEMVPLGSLLKISETGGPGLVTRYNGVTAAAVNGGTLPGVSSGDMISMVEGVADRELPEGMTSQWTELTYMQIRAGNTAIVVFALAVVLVYLLLAAQYESLRLPWAVILVVPMCLLCSVVGVMIARMDLNIFVQIGLVVLVGLASKNAILIVEFAREKRAAGESAFDATVTACRLRLRPILMTSFAFILGVIPLAIATGAGAEMRRTLGIGVFSGMLGVTVFGIFLTPVFYYVLEKFAGWFSKAKS
ncbi:MAG: efflux RND transporter permease subunit [Planctomyces sp.]|nr:efflux RND transporter permease subunit [Planctomyces sp.]